MRPTRLFCAVFAVLALLAALPFLRTELLPFQDYPHLLLFARAFKDLGDPSSPFHGTYTTGFPFSPIALPLWLVRALSSVMSVESAGRAVWLLHAVGLPLAALRLLAVLKRDRWAVVLIFPLVFSYWTVGGFFAFATSSSLFLLALAAWIEWLEAPTQKRALIAGAFALALHLWHSLALATFLLDAGILWLLWREPWTKRRWLALTPLAAALLAFVAWLASTIQGRAPAQKPTAFAPVEQAIPSFFGLIGPLLEGAIPFVMALGFVVLAGASLTEPRRPRAMGRLFRVENPFALLAVISVLLSAALPATMFGVEGIANRQPYIAALLLPFAWSLPRNRRARAGLVALVAALGAVALLRVGARFAAFDAETRGASRLVDHMPHGSNMLAFPGNPATPSFPGKPLVAMDLYASIRHGGLPSASFAGYDVNFIRYVNGVNPMPVVVGDWVHHPGLGKFDYVLLREPIGKIDPKRARLVGRDGDWVLFGVCGGRAAPTCD